MHIIIAEAGLAEAAEFFGLLIIGGILLVASGCLALSWWKHSLVAFIIAFAFISVVGGLFQPWHVIAPPSSDDPDDAYWLVRERFVSVIWAALVIAAIPCLRRVIRRRQLKKADKNLGIGLFAIGGASLFWAFYRMSCPAGSLYSWSPPFSSYETITIMAGFLGALCLAIGVWRLMAKPKVGESGTGNS